MSDTPMTAPTLPEPRPDDYASLLTLAQEAAAAREGQEFSMTFNGIELLNEEQSRAYMLTIRLWNALTPGVVIALIEQVRALTPHPAPFGATDEGKCMTCGTTADEHENVLGRLFCYPFTAETSGEDSCATFTAAPAPDPLRAAVVAFLASWDAMAPFTTRDAPMIAALRSALQAGG